MPERFFRKNRRGSAGSSLLLACTVWAAALGGCAPESAELTVAEMARPGPVFLLGFDGIDPVLLEEFERAGHLPNFAKLREVGAVGRVRSTTPMISPPAWTSVSTGTLPGDHGVWGFWIPDGGNPRGRYVDATQRLAPAIWEDLTAAGRSVGVINVPITCPVDSVNGFMIAGLPYPEGEGLTWPPELEAEIVARGYERDGLRGPPPPGREEEWLDLHIAIAEKRREIGLELLFERRPDLSFIVFTLPDRVQHHLWKFHDPKHPHYRDGVSVRLKNAVRDVYVWCDEILGEVMGELDERGTLFVLSDHGFGPAYLGVSKARIVAELPPDLAELYGGTRNLFGGDFYLEGADEKKRREFADALSAVVDFRGNALVRRVEDTRNGAVRGYGMPLGPDVVADEAEGYLFFPGEPDGPLVSVLPPTAFSGYHRREGYFGAYGRPIQPGEVRDIDLVDIAAMAVHILGEPIPRRYTQSVPKRLFPLSYFVERPMVYSGRPREGLRQPQAASGAASIDESVAAQLESLGYVQSP